MAAPSGLSFSCIYRRKSSGQELSFLLGDPARPARSQFVKIWWVPKSLPGRVSGQCCMFAVCQRLHRQRPATNSIWTASHPQPSFIAAAENNEEKRKEKKKAHGPDVAHRMRAGRLAGQRGKRMPGFPFCALSTNFLGGFQGVVLLCACPG